jgi:integrase
LVLDLLANVGLKDIADWFLGSVAPTTLRNYRRGYSLFSRLVKESGIAVSSINNSTVAISTFVRVLRLAFQNKIKLAAISNMRTAMVRIFSFMFNVDLSQSVIFRMAMRFYTLKNLPRKESLNLHWSVDQLLSYVKQLPPFVKMEFNQLTEVTVVLCLAFTTLRFTEILALNLFESDPDSQTGAWKLWVHVKGHDCLETVVIHSVKEGVPDPVAALVEMKTRIKKYGGFERFKVSWFKRVGAELQPLSYDELRSAAVRVLAAAGINEKRPYHIKHAVLTCLDEEGASMKDIAAFARHRFQSMAAYQHYISYDGGRKSVERIVNRVGKNDKE